MGSLFVSALVLGIAFCAPPGAVTAESVRRGLAGGFRPALLLQLGSLIGDATWAAIALVGAALLVQSSIVRIVLGVVGVLFLFRLAWSALRAAYEGSMPEAASSHRGHFMTGAVLSLANPFAIAFWLGVGGAMAAVGVTSPEPRHFVAFFAGFMFGALLYAVSFSGVVACGQRLLRPGVFRWVNLASSLALGYFALSLLSNLVKLVG